MNTCESDGTPHGATLPYNTPVKRPSIKPWKELRRSTLLEHYGRGLDEVVFRLPNGRVETYVIKKERPTVAILAITRAQQVILVEQFRPGPKIVLRELPGGYINHGESPLAAARRELLEETGYVGACRLLLRYADCAYSTRTRHCMLATQCRLPRRLRRPPSKTGAQGRVMLVPLQRWVNMLPKNPPSDLACALAGLNTLQQ